MVGGLSLFLNLLVLVSPLYMLQVFDRVLPSGHIETLLALTVAAAFALLVFGMLEVIRRQALVRIGAWLDRTLSGPVLAASVGEALVGRATGGQPLRDLAQLRGFIGSESVFPIFDAAVDARVHRRDLAVAPVARRARARELGAAVRARARQRAGDAGAAASRRTSAGWRPVTWRDGGAQRRGGARHGHAAGPVAGLASGQRSRALEHALAGDRGAVFVGVAKFLRLFVQIGILGLGAWLVLGGELTGGGMIAGSILLSRALAPVEQAIGAWKGAGRRARQPRSATAPARSPSRTGAPAIRLPAPEGRVSVERLAFKAPATTA